MQHGHFFPQQLVALALDHEEFQAAFEGVFQLRRVPRFGDVFVNGAGVDGGDGGVHVGVGGGQNANDPRAKLAGFFEQPNALLTRHPLVGHEDPDVVFVLLQQLESVLGVWGGQNAELVLKGAGEVLEGLFFVINVEDGEFFVVVQVVHLTYLA